MQNAKMTGPPCGCLHQGVHEDPCPVATAEQRSAAAALVAFLEPVTDTCTHRCWTLGFAELHHYSREYGVCPCTLPSGGVL